MNIYATPTVKSFDADMIVEGIGSVQTQYLDFNVYNGLTLNNNHVEYRYCQINNDQNKLFKLVNPEEGYRNV